MKKELNEKMLFIGGIIIILLCIIAYLKVSYSNMISKYEAEIERLTNENLKLSEDNNKLSNEINDLSENVYNLFEEQPYRISIEHDGKYITYRQDRFGLFDSYFKSIIYIGK